MRFYFVPQKQVNARISLSIPIIVLNGSFLSCRPMARICPRAFKPYTIQPFGCDTYRSTDIKKLLAFAESLYRPYAVTDKVSANTFRFEFGC